MTSPPTVSCVTFDLDDTLWACGPVIEAAEQAAYDWLAEHAPLICQAHSPAALVTHRQRYMQRYPELHHDLSTLRRRWLGEIGDEFGYGESLAEAAFQVFWQARNRVELFAAARDALDALQGVYRLGSITNGNADVHYIGIGHYFDFSLTAAGVGAAKPDRRIYDAAVAAAGVPAEQIVHVGDDPAGDVIGAAAAGLRTVWVNGDGRPWPGGPPPDATVGSVGELWGLLEGWRRDSV